MAQFEERVSAAAVLFLPFVVFFLALWWIAPPTSAHILASDPLVQLVNSYAGIWAIPLVAALPALAWTVVLPPSRAALGRAVPGVLGGLAVAAVGLPLLRLLAGPTLPGFVPPEESAFAGITLGVGAGIMEEAVFRLGLLSVVFLAGCRVLGRRRAGAVAVVLTAFAFALSHELGPGAGTFDARYFAMRFMAPGCVMSVLFFRPGPSFVVTLHSAAHVGIALLFADAATAG